MTFLIVVIKSLTKRKNLQEEWFTLVGSLRRDMVHYGGEGIVAAGMVDL